MQNALSTTALALLTLTAAAQSDNPMLNNWWINSTGEMHNNAVVDVESVFYTATDVYVVSSGVPSYYQHDESVFNAVDMAYTFRLPMEPQPAVGAEVSTIEEGAVGVLVDGSVAMSPGDAQTWQDAGFWHSLAYEHEGFDFDDANGHSTPQGQYHHHIDPNLLYALDETQHAPIIGFAFDGYPIYGPFGYENADGTGGISRMQSSWQVRSITVRNTLPDGTQQQGPPMDANNPLGSFWEDYEFQSGSGHLDAHNGRFCVTPEYPQGTYAYFDTLDAFFEPQFPYIVGETFYGEVETGNMGPNGADFNIPANAVEFFPGTTGLEETGSLPQFNLFPNPATEQASLQLRTTDEVVLSLVSMDGVLHYARVIPQRTHTMIELPLYNLAAGTYFVRMETATEVSTARLVKM